VFEQSRALAPTQGSLLVLAGNGCLMSHDAPPLWVGILFHLCNLTVLCAGAVVWAYVARQWSHVYSNSTTVVRSYIHPFIADGIIIMCFIPFSFVSLVEGGKPGMSALDQRLDHLSAPWFDVLDMRCIQFRVPGAVSQRSSESPSPST
jgi:hypothetical protein